MRRVGDIPVAKPTTLFSTNSQADDKRGGKCESRGKIGTVEITYMKRKQCLDLYIAASELLRGRVHMSSIYP